MLTKRFDIPNRWMENTFLLNSFRYILFAAPKFRHLFSGVLLRCWTQVWDENLSEISRWINFQMPRPPFRIYWSKIGNFISDLNSVIQKYPANNFTKKYNCWFQFSSENISMLFFFAKKKQKQHDGKFWKILEKFFLTLSDIYIFPCGIRVRIIVNL